MTKKERFDLQLKRHLLALCDFSKELTGEELNYFDAIKLNKSLRRIELKLHRLAENYCNGEMSAEQHEEKENYYAKRIHVLFNSEVKDLYINSDPRGYSLKLKIKSKTKADFFRDWGGYKLLSPELPC